eukprot:7483429-Alexandrium_andersonii.AAC.1
MHSRPSAIVHVAVGRLTPRRGGGRCCPGPDARTGCQQSLLARAALQAPPRPELFLDWSLIGAADEAFRLHLRGRFLGLLNPRRCAHPLLRARSRRRRAPRGACAAPNRKKRGLEFDTRRSRPRGSVSF